MSSSPGEARPTLTVVALCLGGLTVSLTQTLVVPIQSQLPGLLDTSAANAGWVVTVTLLCGAVSMVLCGRLGDMVGKRQVLVATASLLVVGSVVAAVGQTLVPVLAGRALQGLAMGFIPVGIALLREVTPPHLTNTAIASMSATLGVGGAIGLPLAAWVAQTFDWHALFWMSAGLAALLVVVVVLLVPEGGHASGGRLDVVGALGLTLGLVVTLVGVSKGNDWGWGSGRTLGCIAVGLVVLVAWGAHQLRRPDPLVDLRVTARRPVLLTNLAALAIGFGMMAQAIVVPQLLQLPEATGFGLGQSVLAAGLWMAPGGLVMMAFSPVSGGLMTRVGPKRTLMVGAALLAAGYLLALVLMDAPWQLLVATSVISAGVGVGYAAMPTLVMSAVPVTEAGAAVGINSLMRSVGTTCAAAVMTTLLTSSSASIGGVALPTRGAYELCFVVGAAAALVGLVIAALVPHVHSRAERPVATEPVASRA